MLLNFSMRQTCRIWYSGPVMATCKGMIPLLLLVLPLVSAQGEADLVTNLPGLQFQTNFKTYSGYLNANDNGTWRMHYILTESKRDPATDPLLIWFNGGPGCSSYAGLFEELGPFQVNKDGETLYENVYSWNAQANVLYLESPIGVGFSYNTEVKGFHNANDDQTLGQNMAAIKDFFNRVQPKYANYTFFLSGESYAGIYIPMLSQEIVKAINSNSFPNPNFQGAAIGNGFMNVPYLLNSLVLWSAYHGRVSIEDWNAIKQNCNTPGATDVDSYNFFQFLSSSNNIDYNVTDVNNKCGKYLNQLITVPAQQFPYNFYQDCYEQAHIEARRPPSKQRSFSGTQSLNSNTALLLNHISTDNQWGYNCWNEDALATYSNRADVQKALHIDAKWNENQGTWTDCNDDIYNNYHNTYQNTYQFFDYVFKNVKIPNFRFLIYNGDVDTVCNYLGDMWHIRDVAVNASLQWKDREMWYFGPNMQLAGYNQHYYGKSGMGADVTIDVMTVKGAGHMVPNDRPGPSLQMITNFMFPVNGTVQYSNMNPTQWEPETSPMLSGFSIIGGFNVFVFMMLLIFV